MKIHYRTKKLQKICENAEIATKEYGNKMAEKIHFRIDQISAVDNVEYLIQYRIGRCHPLYGDREGQYSMDLIHPYRLIFIKENDNSISVRIEKIEDYH